MIGTRRVTLAVTSHFGAYSGYRTVSRVRWQWRYHAMLDAVKRDDGTNNRDVSCRNRYVIRTLSGETPVPAATNAPPGNQSQDLVSGASCAITLIRASPIKIPNAAKNNIHAKRHRCKDVFYVLYSGHCLRFNGFFLFSKCF